MGLISNNTINEQNVRNDEPMINHLLSKVTSSRPLYNNDKVYHNGTQRDFIYPPKQLNSNYLYDNICDDANMVMDYLENQRYYLDIFIMGDINLACKYNPFDSNVHDLYTYATAMYYIR